MIMMLLVSVGLPFFAPLVLWAIFRDRGRSTRPIARISPMRKLLDDMREGAVISKY